MSETLIFSRLIPAERKHRNQMIIITFSKVRPNTEAWTIVKEILDQLLNYHND